MSTIDITDFFSDYEPPRGCDLYRCHVLDSDKTQRLLEFLVAQLPECYISLAKLESRCAETGCSPEEILTNKLPDPGSIMSGDFGELLSLFFLSHEKNNDTFNVPKWRYKQDRNAAAPKSDVILLYHSDNNPDDDFVICAEAKAKATRSNTYHPLANAVDGMKSDQTSRLGKTLVWLKEKYIADEGSPEEIAYIKRFTGDTAKPFKKEFKAIAIIDRTLLDDELIKEIELPECEHDYEIIALGIEDLKSIYEKVYSQALKGELE